MANIKKTQINEKLEDGSLQIIHPETEASVVIENDNKQFVSKSQKDELNSLIDMKNNNAFGNVSDVQDSNGNSLVTNKIAKLPDYIKSTEKGSNGGVATLDSSGKVPSSQLPSFVDDVLEYASLSSFPTTGESGKIYVALDTNKTYRWSGTTYTIISDTLALGETTGTAYDGAKGKLNAQNIASLDARVGSVETKSNTNSTNITNIINGTTKVGKATTADNFSSSKKITINGDVSGSVETDFSSNPSITLALSNSGVTAGTYSAVQVDYKGRVTSGGQSLEVGTSGQTTPSASLVVGGLFFKEI
jgi:hypothetical protein